MRLLVLGGTVYLSEAVAAEAVRRGHDVVCACRGQSGVVPDGARLVRWDRSTGDPAPTGETGEVDAVVDVARHPSWVRAALAVYSPAHWVFVSSVNVYADEATPGGRPGLTPLLDPILTDEDVTSSPQTYGAMKVGCEQLVAGIAASAALVRPGLIVGPGDPTGRYSYWPERIADGGPVLAGGAPADVVQVVDVRDLAGWLVTLAERRTTGTYDGVGPTLPLGDLIARTATGVGADLDPVWVDHEQLAGLGVEPWAGDAGLPLWLPRPAYDGMLAHDAAPPRDAGLTVRSLEDTARDTLAWLRAHPDAARTGLSRTREQEVLAAVRPVGP